MNHEYTVLHPLQTDVVLFKGLDILTRITCGELKKSWQLKESANETEKPSYAAPERSISTVQLTA